MNTFSINASLGAGWDTFKKRPWFLIGAPILLYIGFILVSVVLGEIGKIGTVLSLAAGFANIVINIFVGMGMISFLLKAYDDPMKLTLRDFWHPEPFWKYVGASLLSCVLVVVGLILLVVPGIILSIVLMFAPYLVIARSLGPVEALKESARITRGHRWALFGLVLMMALVNIVGLLALVAGLLVTIPVTSLAVIHAFRTLEQQAGEVVPVSA